MEIAERIKRSAGGAAVAPKAPDGHGGQSDEARDGEHDGALTPPRDKAVAMSSALRDEAAATPSEESLPRMSPLRVLSDTNRVPPPPSPPPPPPGKANEDCAIAAHCVESPEGATHWAADLPRKLESPATPSAAPAEVGSSPPSVSNSSPGDNTQSARRAKRQSPRQTPRPLPRRATAPPRARLAGSPLGPDGHVCRPVITGSIRDCRGWSRKAGGDESALVGAGETALEDGAGTSDATPSAALPAREEDPRRGETRAIEDACEGDAFYGSTADVCVATAGADEGWLAGPLDLNLTVAYASPGVIVPETPQR